MKIAPVAEIKAQFSSYLKAAATGPVVVTKNGKPIAVLLAMTDEDEIERLLLGYSPKFQAMLDAAEQRIRATGGILHDEFWQQLDAEYAESTANSSASMENNRKPQRKHRRKSTEHSPEPRPKGTRG
jgi:prevent-host-death family protein